MTTVLQVWVPLGGRWRRLPMRALCSLGRCDPRGHIPATPAGLLTTQAPHTAPQTLPSPWASTHRCVQLRRGLQGPTCLPRPPWNRPRTLGGFVLLSPRGSRAMALLRITPVWVGGLLVRTPPGPCTGVAFRQREPLVGGTWGLSGRTQVLRSSRAHTPASISLGCDDRSPHTGGL